MQLIGIESPVVAETREEAVASLHQQVEGVIAGGNVPDRWMGVNQPGWGESGHPSYRHWESVRPAVAAPAPRAEPH